MIGRSRRSTAKESAALLFCYIYIESRQTRRRERIAIERGAPLFMHPQHRTRPQPGSLVITERLHALFQSILAEQGRFAVNALPSDCLNFFENHVLGFLIFTESKKNGLAQTLVARQFTEPDLRF